MNDYIDLQTTLEDIEFLENGEDLEALNRLTQEQIIAQETELLASLPF